MLTLDIAVDHQDRGFVIVYVFNSGRDAFDAEFFTSLPPAMSAYHFIADTNLWSDDDGRNDTASEMLSIGSLNSGSWRIWNG